MKFRNITMTALMLIGLGSVSVAAPPPLDRPTPPPCCADGRCYSSPCTYGWYATRWRRWPVECMDQMPAGKFGQERAPITGINRIEPPSPDDEDRRAPPPTTPPEDSTRGPASNAPPSGTDNRGTSGSTG